MKKPWSISTTVREPDRIREFLKVLAEMEGETWNESNQRKFQILLIQHKVYGYGNLQFYNTLSNEHKKLMDNPDKITYEQAEEILTSKNYVGGGDMRGRQSFNPIEKMGFANIVDNKISISSFGKYFLSDDYDLGDIFFRSFIKWQLPNPDSRDFRERDGYAVKPFIATLHLIKEVNSRWEALGKKSKGIDKQEFAIFVPTLINFQSISEVADEIIEFRKSKALAADTNEFVTSYHKAHISNFVGSTDQDVLRKIVNNTIDYADNIIRYFRLTRYVYIRGNGFYIDIEPRRETEIKSLLSVDDSSPKVFLNKVSYSQYLSDINQPILPWETESSLRIIAQSIVNDTKDLESNLNERSKKISVFEYKDLNSLDTNGLKAYAEELRIHRRELQEFENHLESQEITKIKEYIYLLQNIYNSPNKKSIELERLSVLALNALNDAIGIKPNYPVGDDNQPTFTAPSGKADIECFYITYNSVCEVTMLTDRSQWYNEGQPVMRHLREFEENYPDKTSYCLFIAPRVHEDSAETFWVAIKHGYHGISQRIVPITISQLINLLEILVNIRGLGKRLAHKELFYLYDRIITLTDSVSDSREWMEKIPETVDSWGDQMLTK